MWSGVCVCWCRNSEPLSGFCVFCRVSLENWRVRKCQFNALVMQSKCTAAPWLFSFCQTKWTSSTTQKDRLESEWMGGGNKFLSLFPLGFISLLSSMLFTELSISENNAGWPQDDFVSWKAAHHFICSSLTSYCCKCTTCSEIAAFYYCISV